MAPTRSSRRGFSLIEVVAVLVLVGVVGVVAAMMVLPVIEGFLNAQTSSEHVAKTQVFMTRLERELGATTNVVSSSTTALHYQWIDWDQSAHSSNLAWTGAGQPVTLNGNVFMGEVQNFQLAYIDRTGARLTQWLADVHSVEVVLDLGSAGSVYTNLFHPRNLR